jgi:hypothetical protein
MAKKGKFKCSGCGRSFGMAAHLGRHMSTVHARKGKRVIPAARTKGVLGSVGTLRSKGGGIAAVVGGIQRYCAELAAQCAALGSRIAVINQALAFLGARTPVRKVTFGAGRRRAGYRSGSLKAHVHQVLQAHGGAMAVKDVTAAVRKAGYRSKNKTLDKSVGATLASMRNVVKISRGMFGLK